MKKKIKKIQSNNTSESEKKSKAYTIEELIELGKKNNTIELAPPLFDKSKHDK